MQGQEQRRKLVDGGHNDCPSPVDVMVGRNDINVSVVSPSTADESDFVRRVKEFEAGAWDELYDAYFPKMYRYLYVRVGDRHVAEDLAAEVFEQACKGIRRFRYRGAPISAWLYKVAHNVMVDWRRREKRSREVPAVTDISGGDDTARVADRDELARVMNCLTEEQRQVLVLRHMEGHSAASAGEVMGKKENAIRALEFRALASIRRAMARDKVGGKAS